MRRSRAKRMLFGSARSIAGTVYGTIVVMATVAAGSRGEDTDTGRLAVIVGATGPRPLGRTRVLSRSCATPPNLDR